MIRNGLAGAAASTLLRVWFAPNGTVSPIGLREPEGDPRASKAASGLFKGRTARGLDARQVFLSILLGIGTYVARGGRCSNVKSVACSVSIWYFHVKPSGAHTSSFWTLSDVPQYYKYVDGETFKAGGNEQGEYMFVKGTILVLHSAASQCLRRSRGSMKRSVA